MLTEQSCNHSGVNHVDIQSESSRVSSGSVILEASVRAHAARVIGLGLFFFGSLAYRSQNRDVFGLWSWPYLALIVMSGALFLMVVANAWIRSRRLSFDACQPSLVSVCFDFAVLMWGTGYFINGLDASRNWGQIADLNLFGSSHPLAALVLWAALLVATLGLAELVVPSGRTSKAGAIILAIWVTAVLLVSIEGGIRVFAIVAPQSQGYPTYTTALWTRKFVSLNQAGFRDAEHAPLASVGHQRLLVVGDSLAFGWGLPHTKDRFGEQVAKRLHQLKGVEWTSLNASLGDTHTLTHIKFLKTMQELKPNITILLYAFNDIDYLAQVTPREGQSEHASSFLARISPVRILFENSFLFQNIYVRLRLLTYAPPTDLSNPYENDALLNEHFHDLDRFVSLASASSTVVAIVPFNIGVVASKDVSSDYNHFVKAATAHGLPIWPAGPEVFSGHVYKDLIVNMLDSHPNELAHQLLADRIADRVQVALETHLQNQAPSER